MENPANVKLQKMLKVLGNEIVDAGSCATLLQHYERICSSDFVNEYNCSPTFHGVVRQALSYSLFMNIAKMYENAFDNRIDKETITLRSLLSFCMTDAIQCDSVRVTLIDAAECQYIVDNCSLSCKPKSILCIVHDADAQEVRKVKKKLTGEEIKKTVIKFLQNCIGRNTFPAEMDLPLCDTAKLFIYRLDKLKEDCEKVKQYRNKFFAHNDRKTCFDIHCAQKDVHLFWSVVMRLLDMSNDVYSGISSALDKKYSLPYYRNIGDIRDLFGYVRIGRNSRNNQPNLDFERPDSVNVPYFSGENFVGNFGRDGDYF